MKRRLLSILLVVCLLVGYLPTAALADTGCSNHPQHTQECGYAEATIGMACDHVHTEACGFKEAKAEVPCDQGCTDTDGDGNVDHMEGCAYAPAEEEKNCTHVCSDGTCVYKAVTEAAPCNHVCVECTACTCTAQCSETIDTACPLCAAGGDCKYVEEKSDSEKSTAAEKAKAAYDAILAAYFTDRSEKYPVKVIVDAMSEETKAMFQADFAALKSTMEGLTEEEKAALSLYAEMNQALNPVNSGSPLPPAMTSVDSVNAILSDLPETVSTPEELAVLSDAIAAARAAYDALTEEEKTQVDMTRLTGLENLQKLQTQVDALPEVTSVEKTLEELTALKKELNTLRSAINANPAINAQKLTDQLGAVNDKMLSDIQSRIAALPDEEALKEMPLEELRSLYNRELLAISSAMEVADGTETLDLEKLELAANLVNELIMTPSEGDVKIGEVTYRTLDEAVAAAADGDIIELLADCETAGFNLSKNLIINGGPEKHKVTFNDKGIALWGKTLTFNNCVVEMNGVTSTPYTAEWNWMAICASANASLTLNKTTMTMDGQGLNNPHAIYFCSNNKLNLNDSTLTILNYKQDAVEWDGGDGGYNFNLNNSHYIAEKNRSGITGTFVVTCDNSTIDVNDNTGNGSNGSHFNIKDSTVNFNRNGAHGLSTGWCIVNNSSINANGNGYTGFHVGGTLTADDSTIYVQNNKCNIYISAGLRIQNACAPKDYPSAYSTIRDSTLFIDGNFGPGIFLNAGKLEVSDTTDVTITHNTARQVEEGGGLHIKGEAIFPDDMVIHNNHAQTSGDDVYVKTGGKLYLRPAPVGTMLNGSHEIFDDSWQLRTNIDCVKAIDGWYDDSANMSESGGTQYNRWNAHDAEKVHVKLMPSGEMAGPVSLKAAHGIPVDVHLLKVDADTDDRLPGAEFTVNGDKKIVSDSKGVLTFENLPLTADGNRYVTKTVKLKETNPPKGYQPIKGEVEFFVKKDAINFTPETGTYVVRDGEVAAQIDTEAKGLRVAGDPAFVKTDADNHYVLLDRACINIPVEKVWDDDNNAYGLRPDRVIVKLYGNYDPADEKAFPIQTLELNEKSEWKGVFEGLNEYDEYGELIEYTVTEDRIANYIGVVNGNFRDGFVITNTFTIPPSIDIPVEKIWNDENDSDGFRPDNVTIYLLANGKKVDKVELNKENNWKHTFAKQAKEDRGGNLIVYTIREGDVEHYTSAIKGDMNKGFTVTNTHGVKTIDIPVEKIWKDSNDSWGKRPDSVTIYLYADGKDTGKKLVLTSRDKWKGIFEDLPIYRDGKEIKYSIKEKNVRHYHDRIKGDVETGFKVTNYYESSAMSPFTGDNIMTVVTVLILSATALTAVLALGQRKGKQKYSK